MNVRRVVTGHDSSAKAVFAGDDEVPPLTPSLNPGAERHRLWGGDEAPHFPDDGSPPPHTTHFRPVGGCRFGLFTRPPAVLAVFIVGAHHERVG